MRRSSTSAPQRAGEAQAASGDEQAGAKRASLMCATARRPARVGKRIRGPETFVRLLSFEGNILPWYGVHNECRVRSLEREPRRLQITFRLTSAVAARFRLLGVTIERVTLRRESPLERCSHHKARPSLERSPDRGRSQGKLRRSVLLALRLWSGDPGLSLGHRRPP